MSSKKAGSSSSSGRKANTLETKIHRAVLQAGRPLSQKEVDAIAPDANARIAAINFLSGAGLLRVRQDSTGLSYRAVSKEEFEIKKGLTTEENMVLNHIQSSGNQGIWTKHLKAKTELHQTVLDRCLKSLVQKQLIKSVKGVKYPTRKIFMMAHLEPSVELTGGPWYTDNELDTEFIKLLCSACLRFIRDKTFPKQNREEDAPASSQPLYPISNAPSYPNTQQILNFLSKSKITETKFNDEHVEMLLNVLVLDGEIERLPAFGAAMWSAGADNGDGSGSDSDSEPDPDDTKKSKKRKKSSKSSSSKSKKKQKYEDSEDASDDSDDGHKRKSKISKGKKRKRDDSDEEDVSSSSGEQNKKRKKRKVEASSDEEDADSDDSKRKSKSKRPKSKSSKKGRSDSDSNVDSDSDARSKRSKSKSSRSKSKSKKKLRARSSSPAIGAFDDAFSGGAYVYRAVRQERVALGWSQAPCGGCPVFDFCKDGGPVGPRGCEYYGEWLTKGIVAAE